MIRHCPRPGYATTRVIRFRERGRRECPLWVKSRHRNSVAECPLCAKSGLMHCSKKSLFDHVVGALPQEQRHVEAERLGGFQIDHQLELVRSLDGELARFCALEYAV